MPSDEVLWQPGGDFDFGNFFHIRQIEGVNKLVKVPSPTNDVQQLRHPA